MTELSTLARKLGHKFCTVTPEAPKKPSNARQSRQECPLHLAASSTNCSQTKRQQLLDLARVLKKQHGEVFAQRWLTEQLGNERQRSVANRQENQEHEAPAAPEEEALCPSYVKAATLLECDRETLGPAHESLLLLARLGLDQATRMDPAPHLQTTLWVLSEMSGKSIRTLQRHLLEAHHPWSTTVQKWLDIRPVFGTRLEGIDRKTGEVMRKKRYVGVVFRFFPRTRQSTRARVGRFRERDLIAASDAEQTRFSRPREVREKVTRARYKRSRGLMSLHSSPKEQIALYNWYLENLSVPKEHPREETVNICSDIPKRRALDELLAAREELLEQAEHRGASVQRARSRWVNSSARVLARAFNDHGFTDLWRKALWTALKTELYGGTRAGWRLLQRMIDLADEGQLEPGLKRPVAYAYAQVKEAMETLRRDYGGGRAGVILA